VIPVVALTDILANLESELQSKLDFHEAEIKELKQMYLESRQESAQIKDKGSHFVLLLDSNRGNA
jgi:hypothetical protein